MAVDRTLEPRSTFAAFSLLAAIAIPWSGSAQAPRGQAIETILISDTPLRNEIEQTPGGATLIDGDSLRERNVASLADLLRYVPGVWAESSYGSDSLFFSSRGSNLDATDYDMNGIALLQDGLSVTTADGNNHNRVLDPLSARFATVARGANAMRYGAATLGGAIDFTSPTARNSAPLAVFGSGGSHGQMLARGTFAHEFERFADFANSYRVESYELLGLRAGWSSPRWRVFGEITNATDESYVATVGVRDRADVDADILNPGAPRSVHFGVQAQF